MLCKIKVGLIGGGFIGGIHDASFNKSRMQNSLQLQPAALKQLPNLLIHQIPHSYGDFHEMIRMRN